jgi:transcriptional regulator with XRE-family HTH domain
MLLKTIPINTFLIKYRKQSGLSQADVAERMGLSRKSGFKYVHRLEKGAIQQPSFDTILVYLSAVGVNWITFITELSKEYENKIHQEIMRNGTRNVSLSRSSGMTKNLLSKLDRDTKLYETKIKPPINYYTKVDMELVKQKIEKKVREHCATLRIPEHLISHYLNFAYEIVQSNKYQPVIDKYNIKGVAKSYLTRIMNISQSIYHTEEKKVQKQKPIRSEKRRQMAVKYLQSRIKLIPVETAINDLLVENNLIKHYLFNSYMNFGRECYRVYKKYYHKDQSYMKQELAGLTKSWGQGGLDKEAMEKIKQAIYKLYNSKDNI